MTWDQSAAMPLLLSDGASSYIYGLGDTPIEQVGSDGTAQFLHADGLGTVRTITDSTGNVLASRTYSAYGKKVASSGSTQSPFGYAGQYTDPDTGLIYMRARWYDPSTGQFITRDPLESETGQPYAYADNAPLDTTDPSGLCSIFGVSCAEIGTQGAILVGNIVVEAASDGAATPELAEIDEAVEGGAGEGAADGGESDSVSGGAVECSPAQAIEVGNEDEATGTTAADPATWNAADGYAEIKPGSSDGPTAGKAFPESVRQQALEENPSTCVFCHMDTDSPQVDHSIPRVNGGNVTLDNAQTSCPFCNASKGARDFPVNPPPGYEGQFPPPWWKGGGG